MAKTTTKKDAKRAAKRKSQLDHVERNGAHAYAERVPIMADELRHVGGSATVKELFNALETGKAGLFGTARRVAATFRYDQRQQSPVFDRGAGNVITLRKRQRTASGGKSKRGNGRVSTKRTRSAS